MPFFAMRDGFRLAALMRLPGAGHIMLYERRHPTDDKL